MLINREILKRLAGVPEKRERRRLNQQRSREFKKGMVVQALSKLDG